MTTAITDRNGNEIQVGQHAVMLKGGLGLKGKIGEVRDIKPQCNVFDGAPGVRVTDGPEGFPNWSAWCKPRNIAIVMMPPTPAPRGAARPTTEEK